MRVRTWIVIFSWVAVTGCTMGLGETTTFATRNLAVSGALADGAFEIADTEGVINIIPTQGAPELGVEIFFEAGDDTRVVQSSLQIEGNLGALCPGASVELEEDGGRLVAVGVDGAPSMALAPLMGLEISMRTTVNGTSEEVLVAQRLVMSSTEGEDGFSVMNFEGTTVIDGEPRVITGSFEVARVVENTDVPGWEGESWNGQPITNWE